MEDSDVVRDHTFSETKFAIMEDINRHNFSGVNVEFGMVCILVWFVSRGVRGDKWEIHYSRWDQRPPLQYPQFPTNAQPRVKYDMACAFHTSRCIVCVITEKMSNV